MNSSTWEGPKVLAATTGARSDINTRRRVLKEVKHGCVRQQRSHPKYGVHFVGRNCVLGSTLTHQKVG